MIQCFQGLEVKEVELIARVFDHVSGKMVKGFLYRSWIGLMVIVLCLLILTC